MPLKTGAAAAQMGLTVGDSMVSDSASDSEVSNIDISEDSDAGNSQKTKEGDARSHVSGSRQDANSGGMREEADPIGRIPIHSISEEEVKEKKTCRL